MDARVDLRMYAQVEAYIDVYSSYIYSCTLYIMHFVWIVHFALWTGLYV